MLQESLTATETALHTSLAQAMTLRRAQQLHERHNQHRRPVPVPRELFSISLLKTCHAVAWLGAGASDAVMVVASACSHSTAPYRQRQRSLASAGVASCGCQDD